MRQVLGAVLFLSGVGALPASADTLPASCGAVGAQSYTPPAVTIPAVVLNRGTVIMVLNATVAINGDTSSVAALMASPGPDGISLPEALMATNNDPGTWNIQFAAARKGSTIDVDPAPSAGFLGLPGLSGGNVTINGDIDGDGQPDITLTSPSGTALGLFITSGGNTLYGLALQNFAYGVVMNLPGQKAVSGSTFSDITISNMVISDIQNEAIFLSAEWGVGLPGGPAVGIGSNWDHLLITGNTITGRSARPAIEIDLGSTAGDTLQHTIIANNNITLPMTGAIGIAMNSGIGLGATNNQTLDTLIANNLISLTLPETGIRIATGVGAASANLLDGVEVIGNRILVSGPFNPTTTAINALSGDAASDDQFPSLRPIQYSENNVLRGLSILSNTIEGSANAGIDLQVACCGNANNTIQDVSILGNSISTTGFGVWLVSGSSADYFSRPSSGNTLSDIELKWNSIQVTPYMDPTCHCYPAGGPSGGVLGGIEVWAGWNASGNNVDRILISNNDVDTPLVGIGIIGGFGNESPNTAASPADNNDVTDGQIFCNQADQAPTIFAASFSGLLGVSVTGGYFAASGNQVRDLIVNDNLVGGVLSGASFLANLGTGASGNTIPTVERPGPRPKTSQVPFPD
jgi:hypothetical protein